MAVVIPPPSPIPPVPNTTMLPASGAASGVSWQWLKWFESLRQRINTGAATGVDSINKDTSADQTIVGGPGVSVTTHDGTTTIAGTGTAGGVLSINSDTTAAQQLLAGSNVAIADLGGGLHKISATAPASGITSINADATPAQVIAAGSGISVATVAGTTTITNTSGGGGGGITSINTDTTPAQVITGAGSASVATAAGTTTITVPAGVKAGSVGLVVDGAGSTPATGSKGYIQVPYNATITGWTMLADVSGSAQVTVKKAAYAGFPTTASIVASAPPLLSSAQKNTSTTLTGWTTAITAGDVLEFNLDSAATVKRIMLELQITKM